MCRKKILWRLRRHATSFPKNLNLEKGVFENLSLGGGGFWIRTGRPPSLMAPCSLCLRSEEGEDVAY